MYSISPYPNTDNLLAIVLLAEVGGVPGHPGFESHSLLPVQVQVSSKILLRKANESLNSHEDRQIFKTSLIFLCREIRATFEIQSFFKTSYHRSNHNTLPVPYLLYALKSF